MIVRRLPSAVRDIDEIYVWIATHDQSAAERIVLDIERAIDWIAAHPRGAPIQRGRVHKKTVRNYRVLYKIMRGEVIVGRIVHARRDLRRIRFRV